MENKAINQSFILTKEIDDQDILYKVGELSNLFHVVKPSCVGCPDFITQRPKFKKQSIVERKAKRAGQKCVRAAIFVDIFWCSFRFSIYGYSKMGRVYQCRARTRARQPTRR